MAKNLQGVLKDARRLTPIEQIDLIRALSESLELHERRANGPADQVDAQAILDGIKRTPPAHSLEEYVADFWPVDESIDELTDFVRQQRDADRFSDQ